MTSRAQFKPGDFSLGQVHEFAGAFGRVGGNPDLLQKAIEDAIVMKNIVNLLQGKPQNAAIEEQITNFLKLGYPKAAGMTEKKFISMIPLSENRPGKLLIIPANLVSIDKQMKLINGTNYLNLSSHKDLIETPKTPYWIYGVENGKKMLGKDPDTCVGIFKKEKRRELITVEGIAIVVQDPDVLKDHYIDLPGSRYGSDRVPSLLLYDDGPRVICLDSDGAVSHYGSASCGS
ncbi:MAG: DUF5701 family protein [Patescibacteria group bacterium]|jgi:hypothetical protein